MSAIQVDGSVYGTPHGIRVYPVKDRFVVADDGGWVPGSYETVDEAVQAARNISSGSD